MSFDPEERALRDGLARTAIQTYQRGLVAGTGGNVSVRVPGRDVVLITPTGLALDQTTVENIVRTDLQAAPLDASCPYRPSKETGFHCAVYRVRPEVNAVVHAHSPYATAFSLRFNDLPLVTVSAAVTLKRVPCIDVALSGTAELRQYVEEGFANHPESLAILMRAHGVIAAGPDLATAYAIADLVEDTARTAHLSAALGISLAESVAVAFRKV